MTQTKQANASCTARRFVKPRADILENETGLVLLVDLPGVSEQDIRIDLDQGRLTIETASERAARDGRELLTEYRPADFRRAFLISEEIDAEGITAGLKDGVLRVDLPKAARLQPRRIAVQPAS